MNTNDCLKKKTGALETTPDIKNNYIFDTVSITELPKKSIVCFSIENEPAEYIVKGRQAQALFALNKAGVKGVTAQEVSSWALRFAGYIFRLRHDCGLNIEMKLEPQSDKIGNFGRYFLLSPISIKWVMKAQRKVSIIHVDGR